MFDKNNWYIEEKELTEDQYREVCKYLVENYKNADKAYTKIPYIAKGDDVDNWCRWDVVGVVGGRYDVYDLPWSDLDDCIKITYEVFTECLLGYDPLLNRSKIDSESVSEETNTNTKDSIEQHLKLITELCSRNDITLTFTPQLRVEVYSDFGEWHVDLTEENDEEQLLKIIEAVKVLNEADKL